MRDCVASSNAIIVPPCRRIEEASESAGINKAKRNKKCRSWKETMAKDNFTEKIEEKRKCLESDLHVLISMMGEEGFIA